MRGADVPREAYRHIDYLYHVRPRAPTALPHYRAPTAPPPHHHRLTTAALQVELEAKLFAGVAALMMASLVQPCLAITCAISFLTKRVVSVRAADALSFSDRACMDKTFENLRQPA